VARWKKETADKSESYLSPAPASFCICSAPRLFLSGSSDVCKLAKFNVVILICPFFCLIAILFFALFVQPR
jgi:hypothetical protein